MNRLICLVECGFHAQVALDIALVNSGFSDVLLCLLCEGHYRLRARADVADPVHEV